MLDPPSKDLLQAIALLRGSYIGSPSDTQKANCAIARLLMQDSAVDYELRIALARAFDPSLGRTAPIERPGKCVLIVQHGGPGQPPPGPVRQTLRFYHDCELGEAVERLIQASPNRSVKAAIARVAREFGLKDSRVKQARSVYEKAKLDSVRSRLVRCLAVRSLEG